MKMCEEMNKPQVMGMSNNLHDPSSMTEVLAFVEELRSSSNGWQRCVESLINGEIQDDRLKFLGLQTIEYYLKNNYEKAPQTEQDIVRQFLSRWIQLKCGQLEVSDAVFVKNKAAQIFALAFVHDFPHRWPTFFSDLIETLSLGPKAVDHFLRVLSAIDTEIADREMPYTQIQIQRNTIIKNAMRETCVEKIVSALYDILNTYEMSHPQLASHCLEALANYIHWIDIGLVANEHFVGTLLRLLNLVPVRESVIVCMQSIVHKGMDPLEKFTLVESLICVLNNVGVFVRSADDDSEFCTKLSHLVNSIGLALLDSFNKTQKSGPADKVPFIEQAIDAKVPIMVTFLGNDYDDVSSAVLEFAKDYVHFLKGRPSLNEQQVKNTQQLMVTVIHKMKYDESYKFDHDGEDEAEFQDFRKNLKVVFDNLVGLNKDLVFNYIMELATRAIGEWRTSPFADVEVSLAVVYYVGEVLPTHAGQYAPNDHVSAHILYYDHMEVTLMVQLHTLLCLILDSGVSAYPHPAVPLQFFEVMTRYQRILLPEPQRILSIISAFLGTCGLRHPNAKVRSRAAYLFCKFIKGSKAVIQAFTKDILVPLQELLTVSNQTNGCKEDWMSSDDQLFLFEAAGTLIISSTLPDAEKVTAFKTLLLPIISKYEYLLKEISQENNVKRQEALANSMCHMIAITTRTSKAFTTQMPMKSIGCVPVYIDCLNMFLNSLQVSVQSSTIQNSVRQFLHRMVVCLDTEILPYIPRASQGLLKNNDIKSMQEYIPLLVQIISKFKKDVQPFLQECLTPIVTAIFSTLLAPLEEGDEDGKVEKNSLRKLYFQFISAVITNAIEVFHGQQNVVKQEILMSVVQGADDPIDPVMQKNCFVILRKLIESSGEEISAASGNEFLLFMHQTVIRLCFEVVLKSACTAHTPNTDVVLMECAACLKAMYNKRGEEMVTFVETTCLANPQIPPQRRGEFAFALKSDTKTLKNFLKERETNGMRTLRENSSFTAGHFVGMNNGDKVT
ncbi:Uncharacterized protein GBIM_18537 [Gryllus bimaculatus]|nr:Uncharacterized protein GBIM_18537 [Gryllus bimaculatus]